MIAIVNPLPTIDNKTSKIQSKWTVL